MSKENNFNRFFADEIVFERHGKPVTVEQINEIIDDFPGKEDFIEFYLAHNGGVFTNGAYFYTNDLYEASNGDYKSLEVASFLHVPLPDENDDDDTMSIEKEKDRRKDYSEQFEEFVLFSMCQV